MQLAHTVLIAGASGERREILTDPLSIHEVAARYTRPGSHPMVTMAGDGIARVSFPNRISKQLYWE
jgi:hypothetical protein